MAFDHPLTVSKDELVILTGELVAMMGGWEAAQSRVTQLQQSRASAPTLALHQQRLFRPLLHLVELRELRSNQDVEYLPLDIESFYDLYAFVSTFMLLRRASSVDVHKKLSTELSQAVERGFGALLHQLTVIKWLRRAGYTCEIADAGPGGYDLLATRGNSSIEIECKNITTDKGRRIIEADFTKLADFVRKDAFALNTDGAAILIEAEDRLPVHADAQRQIATECIRLIREDSETQSTTAGVRLTLLPPTFPDPRHGAGKLQKWVERTVGTHQARIAAFEIMNGRIILLVARSLRRDAVLKGMEAELSEGHRQLAKRHPGLLALGLEGVTSKELAALASESSLRDMTRRYFLRGRDGSRDHVRGIVYFAEPAPPRRGVFVVSAPISSMCFSNPRTSPFAVADPTDLLG